jgi:hypothetical protein
MGWTAQSAIAEAETSCMRAAKGVQPRVCSQGCAAKGCAAKGCAAEGNRSETVVLKLQAGMYWRLPLPGSEMGGWAVSGTGGAGGFST